MAELVRGGCKPSPTPTQLDELFEHLHEDHEYFASVMTEEDMTLSEEDEGSRDELRLKALALRFGISCFKFGFRLPVPDDFTHEDLGVDDENPILTRGAIAGSAPHADGTSTKGAPAPNYGWGDVAQMAKR